MLILAHDFRGSKCIIVKKVKQSNLVSGLGSRKQLIGHILADRKQRMQSNPRSGNNFQGPAPSDLFLSGRSNLLMAPQFIVSQVSN